MNEGGGRMARGATIGGTMLDLSFSTKWLWENFGFLSELPTTAFKETLVKEAFTGLANISTKKDRYKNKKNDEWMRWRMENDLADRRVRQMTQKKEFWGQLGKKKAIWGLLAESNPEPDV